MKVADGFTSVQLMRLTGIPRPTFLAWLRSGLIRASVRQSLGTGPGRGSLFSFRDLCAIRAVRELRDRGVTLPEIRKVVAAIRRQGEELESVRLVVSGGRAFAVDSGAQLVELLTGQGAFAFVLDLAPLVREMRAAVKHLRAA